MVAAVTLGCWERGPCLRISCIPHAARRNSKDAATLAREEDDSAEPRGPRTVEELADIPPRCGLAGTGSTQPRVHGSPGMAIGSQCVPQPTRALRGRKVHGR